MDDECGKHNTVGSRCVKAPGHNDSHESRYGCTWTDESNARAAEAMAREASRWRYD